MVECIPDSPREGEQPRSVSVGNASQDHGPEHTRQCAEEADGPLDAVDASDLKGLAADEDNHDLPRDHDDVDDDEEGVAVNAFEDVAVVVETATVEFVEDLHPDEGVEDDCVELCLDDRVGGVVAEDGSTGEVEDKGDDELVDGLTDDHFPHVGCDEWGAFGDGFAIQDLIGRSIGGES